MDIVEGKTRSGAPTECPVCGGDAVESMFSIPDVPVYCNVLYEERDDALAAKRAEIALAACQDCGHVFNSEFDPGLVDYDVQYENSLHFSPRFQRYATRLADELVDKYDLHDKQVVEVACGKGEFLSLLRQRGARRTLGFDPSYPEDAPPGIDERVEVVPAYFDPAYALDDVGLLCCRHALEHVAKPRGFLDGLRRSLNGDGAVYFEVPNADYMLAHGRAWDVIYEHCGYFTRSSLIEVFRRAGFDITETMPRFGEQFLSIEARVSEAGSLGRHSDIGAKPAMGRAEDFSSLFREQKDRWQRALEGMKQRGERVVVWGAGSKGVTFINIAAPPGAIDCLVDLNPRKQGRYVAGTGDLIRAPSELRAAAPDVVIVMNKNYHAEVGEILGEMGIQPTIMCA